MLVAGIAAAASAAAVTLTPGSAPAPTRATLTSALTRTLRQSYHLVEHDGLYTAVKGQPTVRAHYTCTGETDPVRHLQAYSCLHIADVVNERQVGRYTYSYSAVPTDGKHWFRYLTKACAANLPGGAGAVTTAQPQQMLTDIKKAYKITVVGPVSGPGWTGTRYAFTTSSKILNKGVDTDSGTVDVDQQGRARSLTLAMRESSGTNVSVRSWALTFSDFGAPVTVTPPPPDQTTTAPFC